MTKQPHKTPPPVSAQQENFLRAHHRHHHRITLGRLFLLLLFLGLWETAAVCGWIASVFLISPYGN
ncbi:MAG: hypothetical protein K2I53_12355, partial [Lachnospiraceae bacterium]|nr:hypothetical protein [Lachnospiraceae bacterium]